MLPLGLANLSKARNNIQITIHHLFNLLTMTNNLDKLSPTIQPQKQPNTSCKISSLFILDLTYFSHSS